MLGNAQISKEHFNVKDKSAVFSYEKGPQQASFVDGASPRDVFVCLRRKLEMSQGTLKGLEQTGSDRLRQGSISAL